MADQSGGCGIRIIDEIEAERCRSGREGGLRLSDDDRVLIATPTSLTST